MLKKSKFSSVSRRLGVEPLEDRRLMAGDITAQVTNGSLIINETAVARGQASDISIMRMDNGDVRVSANPKTGGHVNGQAFVDFHKLSTPSLSVNLGDGADKLQITNMAFNKVDIAMGEITSIVGDNDVVTISGVTTRGQMNITTGDGNDAVTVTQSHIGNGLADAGETELDQLMILTGKGADSVTIGDTTHLMDVKGVLHINTTSDRFLDINGRPNQTELGDDRVSLTSVDVTNNINVWLGSGTNLLSMTGVNSGSYFSLYGGGGQDTARLRDVTARDGFFARMGAGNDTLDLNNVRTPLGPMVLDGGAGIDTLIRSANSTGQTLSMSNWE
jgi:hypothetical protein